MRLPADSDPETVATTFAPIETLGDQLERARSEVLRLEGAVAQGPCREFGHQWEFHGGCNAGCSESCGCSVSVNVCSKCGECDYGDNAEATAIRRVCEDRNA